MASRLRAPHRGRAQQGPPRPVARLLELLRSGATAEWEGGYRYEGHAFGIGSAFLLAGVRSYARHVLGDPRHGKRALRDRLAIVASRAASASARRFGRARHAVIAERGCARSHVGEPPPLRRSRVHAARGVHVTARARRSRAARRSRQRAPRIRAPRSPPPSAPSRPPPVAGRAAGSPSSKRSSRSPGAETVGGVRERLPGIGKTTVVEVLARVREGVTASSARGSRSRRMGPCEAVSAVARSVEPPGRTRDGADPVGQLRRHAPSWLAELPSLAGVDASRRRQKPSPSGATRERMLREMAELVEAITIEHPLVLAIEDLHWGDPSTLELVAYLAQRHEPARPLLIATYRTAEALRRDAPLRAISPGPAPAAAWRTRSASRPLAVADVDAYVRGAIRRRRRSTATSVGALVHDRTEGHPLFVVSVVDYALRERLLTEDHGVWQIQGGAQALASQVPDTLRQLIEHQIETLRPLTEQRLLEAASVVGNDFSVAEVAAALARAGRRPGEPLRDPRWERPDGARRRRRGVARRHRRGPLSVPARLVPGSALRPGRRGPPDPVSSPHRRAQGRRPSAHGSARSRASSRRTSEAARELERALSYRTHAGGIAVARHADLEAVDHLEARRSGSRAPPTRPHARRSRARAPSSSFAAPLMAVRRLRRPRGRGGLRPCARAVARRGRRITSLPALAGPGLLPSGPRTAASPTPWERSSLSRARGGGDAPAIVQAHYGHGATLYDLGELRSGADASRTRPRSLRPGDSTADTWPRTAGTIPGSPVVSGLAWIAWWTGAPDRALVLGEDGLTSRVATSIR